jgi:CRISPR-associated endoribonuclease Cas6
LGIETAMGHELFACRLTLRPGRTGALLPGSGRAVQGWWLDYVRAADPELAARLHAESERRPFSCAPLGGLPMTAPGSPAPVVPERAYSVRLAAWDAAVVTQLAALVDGPPEQVMLGDTPFAVVGAEVDQDTPPATFAALAARHLLPLEASGNRPPDVTLRFETATSFRQAATPEGRPQPVPFPLPGLVWCGLFDRWQAASSVGLEPSLRASLATRVAVSRFAGESQRVLLPGIADPHRRVGATGGQWVVGFTGRCTYWTPRGDGYLAGAVRLLAAFAEYAGVGQGTAYGLGQVRWIRPQSSRSAG